MDACLDEGTGWVDTSTATYEWSTRSCCNTGCNVSDVTRCSYRSELCSPRRSMQSSAERGLQCVQRSVIALGAVMMLCIALSPSHRPLVSHLSVICILGTVCVIVFYGGCYLQCGVHWHIVGTRLSSVCVSKLLTTLLPPLAVTAAVRWPSKPKLLVNYLLTLYGPMTINSNTLLSASLNMWTVARPWNLPPFRHGLHSCSL